MGGISVWQLLIIAVIVLLIFGSKKLESIGADLGASIKGFRKAMDDDENKRGKFSQNADPSIESLAHKQDDLKKDDTKHHNNNQA